MDKVDKILENLVNEINIQLDDEQKLNNSDEELLAIEGSKLDSLALLSFISILEENTAEYDIDFMDIIMSGDENKIFETVGSLKNFLLDIR